MFGEFPPSTHEPAVSRKWFQVDYGLETRRLAQNTLQTGTRLSRGVEGGVVIRIVRRETRELETLASSSWPWEGENIAAVPSIIHVRTK
ncbi:MAG TPA: hypothetical protein VIK88_04165 [Candidatus Bathyarchaeia archaeon]